MNKNTGYQINQKDIETTISYLKTHKLPHTTEDAINFLEEKTALAHISAHKIVEDERSGKIKKVKTN